MSLAACDAVDPCQAAGDAMERHRRGAIRGRAGFTGWIARALRCINRGAGPTLKNRA
jgi:hypothetical protein